MKTPCIKVCKLVDNKCTGCGRTKDQITNWIRYSDYERNQIIKDLL